MSQQRLRQNANGTPILNAQKRKGIIESLQKKYFFAPWNHGTSPLFDTKMLEGKPIAKLMDTCFRSNPR